MVKPHWKLIWNNKKKCDWDFITWIMSNEFECGRTTAVSYLFMLRMAVIASAGGGWRLRTRTTEKINLIHIEFFCGTEWNDCTQKHPDNVSSLKRSDQLGNHENNSHRIITHFNLRAVWQFLFLWYVDFCCRIHMGACAYTPSCFPYPTSAVAAVVVVVIPR